MHYERQGSFHRPVTIGSAFVGRGPHFGWVKAWACSCDVTIVIEHFERGKEKGKEGSA